MKSLTIIHILLFMILVVATNGVSASNETLSSPAKANLQAQLNGAYHIGIGDVLMLSVWRDEALSRTVRVLPDGNVSLPLIGQLSAAGKTIAELEFEVTEQIKRYLPDPVLDISIGEVNSMLIYVIGKVRAPGRYPVQSRINVLQALAMAGGLDKFAEGDDIKVYRDEGGQTTIYEFDYEEVTRGKQLTQNIKLQRGDVVVIP